MVVNDGHGFYRAEIVPAKPGTSANYMVFFYPADAVDVKNKPLSGEIDYCFAHNLRDAKKAARKGFRKLHDKTHIVIYEGE